MKKLTQTIMIDDKDMKILIPPDKLSTWNSAAIERAAMQIEGSRKFKLFASQMKQAKSVTINVVNTCPTSVTEMDGNRREKTPPPVERKSPTGRFDDLNPEQKTAYNAQVRAARKAVDDGILEPVAGADGELKTNMQGKYAPCVLLPNANQSLKTCPLVDGVARCGHYPDQCPENSKTSEKARCNTQRAPSLKHQSQSVAALAAVTKRLMDRYDNDPDASTDEELDSIKADLQTLM